MFGERAIARVDERHHFGDQELRVLHALRVGLGRLEIFVRPWEVLAEPATPSGVSDPFTLSISPAMPETSGVAADVPLKPDGPFARQ